MNLYVITTGLYLDTGKNPRLTHGDRIAEGEANVDAAIAAFDQLVASSSSFSINLIDGGGIHITSSDLNWLTGQAGLPSPTHVPACRGYYSQWFPLSETGSNDFARFHRHVSDYVRTHPRHASPQAMTWLTGPYRLVPNA